MAHPSLHVESAPSIITPDRAANLLTKWSEMLDFEDSQTKAVVGHHKRLATAMAMENQENWLKSKGLFTESPILGGGNFSAGPWGGGTPGSAPSTNGQYGNALKSSDWYAPGDARLPKTLIPMIRRTFPELITHEIVGVQPMSGPVGLAFAMRYFYDQDPLACTPYTDSNCNRGNTFPTGNLGSGEAGYQNLFNGHTGITAAGLTGLGTAYGAGSGSCFDFVPGHDSGVAQLLSHFEASSNIPTMSLKIEKKAVEAGTRRLASGWSMEVEQDLMNMNGIDIDAEMTNVMSYEIQAEIDREMVMRMIQITLNAGLGNGYTIWRPSLADARWLGERGVDFYAKIVVEANRMAVRNRRGPANFIIATPKVCTILQLLKEFKPFTIAGDIQAHPNGVARVGTLAGQFNIYRDTRTEAQYFAGLRAEPVEYALLGYKGAEYWDTGLVYCPYIPVLVQRTITPNSFEPRVGLLTRYAVMDNLFGSENYYHLIIAKDLNRGYSVDCNSCAPSACTPTYMS